MNAHLREVDDLLWSGIREKRWAREEAISWAASAAGLMIGMFFFPSENDRIVGECLQVMRTRIAGAQAALKVEYLDQIVNRNSKR